MSEVINASAPWIQSAVDAELSLLGCAIESADCYAQTALLKADLFTTPETKAIHKAIKDLYGKGVAVPDMVAIINAITDEAVEPYKAVMSAQQRGVAPMMFGHYKAICEDYRLRRMAAKVGGRLVQDAMKPDVEISGLIASACSYMQKGDDQAKSGSIKDFLMDWYDKLYSRENRCFTGLADLDNLTGGITGGKLIVMAARPGVGKTAMALQMGKTVARRTERNVLFVSLEMDENELLSRIVASETGVDSGHIESHQLTDEDHMAIGGSLASIANLPIMINTHLNTPMQIRREAASIMARKGLAMIVVDYLQLMRSDQKLKSRYEEVSAISRELKILAQDLGIPIIALSQLNRQSEATQGMAERRAPSMAEARDSGSIEQDANLFLLLWAPPEPKDTSTEDWERWHRCQVNGWTYVNLIVAKNRSGRTGLVALGFDKAHMNFINFERQGVIV